MRPGTRFFLIILSLSYALLLNRQASAQALKGQSTRTHALVLSKSVPKEKSEHLIRIGFIGDGNEQSPSPEGDAAFHFLKKQPDLSPSALTFEAIRKKPGMLGSFSIIWIHSINDALPEVAKDKKVIKAFRDYLNSGGKLFLTMDAFKYLVVLGLETEVPKDSLKITVDDGYGRKLGYHACYDHPIFEDMQGGAYIMMPVADTAARITGYFGDSKPANGKVVGVDWDYIFLRENSKLVLEYNSGKGKVIAAGAYMWFSAANRNRAHLDRFTGNIIRYLSGEKMQAETHYWNYATPCILQAPVPESKEKQFLPADKRPWITDADPLSLVRPRATDNFWDVAGERMLTMGSENGGIEEIWAHPFMAFRDYEAGIRFSDKDSIFWLRDGQPQVEIRPECFIRNYHFPNWDLKEIIVNDPKEPAGVIHYEYKGASPAEMIIRFRSNMRLMWPYSEKVSGSLCYSFFQPLQQFTIYQANGKNALILGADREAKQALSGRFGSIKYDPVRKEFYGTDTSVFMVSGLSRYELGTKDVLNVVYCATNEGLDSARAGFFRAMRDPHEVYENAARHCREVLRDQLTITGPEKDFNTGYRWALLAANRFFVRTPGMGTSLVAGYSTTAHGWDGGHAVNGRPGYSWYFGRDGEWSGFAFLETGNFEGVKSELEFYRKFQDLSGKIVHEATTSGVIHYDAADATPLYIQLAGRYFRATNDTSFLRSNWPFIKKAIDFCFSTDTDRDHLIENTGVGHGWVEGGELYGSHATLYLQGCWSAALSEAAVMAAALKLPDADYYAEESKTVRQIINWRFWNSEKHFYSYGMNKDRSFRTEPTILPAVPAGFKLFDKENARFVLKQYASNAFSTNWGTRIIRDDSPLFKPEGYHYGSVWPLFTGWASLAEYAYGNDVQGYFHLMNNLRGYRSWGQGFVQEVLNGSQYKPSGVCAHQCWSETMVLQPAIEGMLGLNVNVPDQRIGLAPHLPADWDSLAVEGIHAGKDILELKMKRDSQKYSWQIRKTGSTPLTLDFLPSFPSGTVFTRVTMNGEPIQFTTITGKQSTTLIVNPPLWSDQNLEIWYDKGIQVIPVTTDPKPGDPAEGMRILSTKFERNTYEIELENNPASHGELTVYLHKQEPVAVENATIIRKDGDYLHLDVEFEAGLGKYVTRTVKIVLGQ